MRKHIYSHWERVRCLWRTSSKVCTKNRLQGSEQLQTVFAMYNQDLSRDRVAPSYQKLRRMVDNILIRRSGHAISKPGMELKQEYWSRANKKGRNVSAKRKVGECFQWKANGQCSRGDSCRFYHGSHSGQRAPSSSSTSRAPTQTDGRKQPLQMWQSERRKSFRIEGQKTV